MFERLTLGTVTLSEGPETLKAQVVKAHGNEVMRLNRIFLRRVGDTDDTP